MRVLNFNIESVSKSFHHAPTWMMVALTVLAIVAPVKSQSNSTSNKPDQNLKSSARVNPLTLAMEFRLPFGSYMGRGGNSVPIFLNYSSKLWEMEKINDRGETVEANDQYYDYIRYHSIDVGAFYSKKSASGWTSSLMPVTIVESSQFFDEYGQIPDGFLSQQLGSLGGISGGTDFHEGDCFWSEVEIVFDSGCMGLAYRTSEFCWNDGFYMESGQVETECVFGGGGWPGPSPTPEPFPTPEPPPPPPPPVPHKVHRVRLQMPDGSTAEFRKDDKVYNCTQNYTECYGTTSADGPYLSVDGSGMRFVRREQLPNNEIRDVLYLPDGGRYFFPNTSGQPSTMIADKAVKFVDKNGNVSNFDPATMTWTDTLGRSIVDPLKNVSGVVGVPPPTGIGTFPVTLPGLNGQDLVYSITWAALSDSFESQTTSVKKLGQDLCNSVLAAPNNSPALFENQADDPMFDQIEGRARYITKYRMCAAPYGWGGNTDFDPIVLSAITTPSGEVYTFRYNEYGEITKITYPSGSYERFVYGQVNPIGFSSLEVFAQGNRGVLTRFVSEDGVTEQQWTHTETSTTAPDGSKVEKQMHVSTMSVWGFEDPLSGMPKEETAKDTNGVIRSRTINDWITAPALQGGSEYAKRYPRLRRSVTINFEPNSAAALATMSENEYDENGSSDPTDFSQLNIKRKKSYHYVVIPDKTTVDTESIPWSTIEGWFTADKLASITETDYSYDSAYKARGILGRPVETRVLNPANPSDVLAKTQFVYDETAYFDNSYTTTNWEDPNSNLRGNVTTTRTWNKDTDTWLESHTMYDNFGNVRKVWDASGDTTKFIETQYDPAYKYAYPTKVIAPAPDPNDTTGTNQSSTVETTYDFSTGLPLSVKDDFGQITKTEYDAFLRPVRVYADNFTAPESQTIYGVPDSNGQYPANQRFVKVRKQIDGTNWDEAITWSDGLGRTIKTQAKDSQGDVFVETVYDAFGRVERVTNPYRQGDTVYWSKTRYDEMNRAVESFAPIELANLANAQSLGVTSFNISTVPDFVGTVVTTTDASGRKGRSITNALGQLLRVDEPTAIGGSETNDLGSLATPHQPTFYHYSPQGQMVRVQQGVQNRYFLYDSLGRLIRVRQPEQEVNTSLNLSDAITGNSQWTGGFTYDVLGNVLTATDAKGTVITNTYDRANRVKTRSYSDNTPLVSLFYDGKGLAQQQSPNYAKGKLTKVTSSVSETQNQIFDNLGRLTQSSQITDGQTFTSKYAYNLSGALIEEEYPSGRKVKTELRSDGELSRISSRLGDFERTYANGFHYSSAGKITYMRLGNGRWETAKYNERFQLTELGLGASSTDTGLLKLNYEYGELDSTGNSLDVSKNIGVIARQVVTLPGLTLVQSFKYDAVSRLTSAIEKTGVTVNWEQQFGYDKYGNRISFFQQVGQTASSFTPPIDANTNRVVVGQGFSYDKNGNVVEDIFQESTPRSFGFDGNNQVVEVKDGSEALISKHFFDGEGKRVKKWTYVNGVLNEKTVFVYSSGKLIAEYSNLAPTTAETKFLTEDHLGTPRTITNQYGDVSVRRDFLPFGEQIPSELGGRSALLKYNSTNDGVRQHFTGYLKEAETDLDYAEARLYDNRIGRFNAVDPDLNSSSTANPQTYNRYVYVGNNPVNIDDPTGKNWAWRYDEKTNEYVFQWYDGGDGNLPSGFTRYRDKVFFGGAAGGEPVIVYLGSREDDYTVIPRSAYEKWGLGDVFDRLRSLPTDTTAWESQDVSNLVNGLNFVDSPSLHNTTRDMAEQIAQGFGMRGAYSRRGVGAPGSPAQSVPRAVSGPGAPAASSAPSGPKVFSNLAPNDAVNAAPLKRLFFDGRKYRYMGGSGQKLTPAGLYNYIVRNGQVYISRTRYGHIDLARGGDVEYAGQIRFGKRGKAGSIRFWNNASGHYQPGAEFSVQAPLPQSVFRPYSGQ